MKKLWIGAIAVAIAVGVVWWLRRDGSSSEDVGAVGGGSAAGSSAAPRTIVRAAGRRIAGKVVDENGAPVRGATVKVASATRAEASAVTDDAGAFDVGPQPAAQYVVVADAPRLTSALASVDLRDPMAVPAPDQLRLVLHACQASLHGTVRDAGGGAIAGALVARANGRLSTSAGAIADANGVYELCVPMGGAYVTVKAEGYAPVSDYSRVYGRTKRDFALSPGASVVGRVVRAGDRAAVANAVVELRANDERDVLTATSDDDGRFRLDGVPPGRHAVTATAERLATQHPVAAIAEVGRAPEEIVLEMAPTFAIAGKVVQRGTTTPAAGVWIYAAGADSSRQVRSQSDGSFTFDVVPGEYRVAAAGMWTPATRRDLQMKTTKVENADVTDLVLEIDGSASISGRVLRDGKPLDGALVRCERTTTNTDADGRYTLHNLPAGTYQLYAQSDRIGAFTQNHEVVVADGEQRTGVDLELELAGSIAGVVVDQNGAPVAGAFLAFSLVQGRDFGNATTADDGSFTVGGLSGGGDYTLDVRPRDGASLVFPPLAGKRHPPIAVRDGATHVTGARIAVRVDRLAIAGRVVDADGKPVADVRVRAVAGDRGWYGIAPATTDERGAFTIRDLVAGTYAVVATGTRGDAREDRVAAGRSDVALRLQAFGAIDGTLEGFATPPREIYVFRYDGSGDRFHQATVTGATFHVDALPAGNYGVSAREGSRADVVVSAGATAKVTLRALRYGSIVATVVDAKHAPLSDILCHASSSSGGYADEMAKSDASGTLRLERVPAGDVVVRCEGNVIASAEVALAEGQTAQVELVATPRPKRGYLGLTPEQKLDEVVVKSVEPGGPAARAGIAAGDTIVEVNGEKVSSVEYLGYLGYAGSVVKLKLERADKEVEVSVTLEAR